MLASTQALRGNPMPLWLRHETKAVFIPSPSCIPKGMPAVCFSKDTTGTHIHTKHSSPGTAAGIL